MFSKEKVNWGKHKNCVSKGLTYKNINIMTTILAVQRNYTTTHIPTLLFLMCF